GEERLEWQGFHARFFPDSRRHDFDALASYQSYVKDAEARPADGGPLTALPSATGVVHAYPAGDRPAQRRAGGAAATGDTERWEGDGGASAARPRRRRRGERPVGTHKV